MKKKFHQRKRSQSGFIIADFLFSFVIVLSIGIIMFALTFALATVEIAQYIVWSSARTFSSGNVDESAGRAAALAKFNNLSAQFPKLTGAGGEGSPWFMLDNFSAQNFENDPIFQARVSNTNDRENRSGAGSERRTPWIGARADIYLKLFANMSIPFFGKVSTDAENTFKFQVYSFVIRNPSYQECVDFFKNRFTLGVQPLDSENFKSSPPLGTEIPNYVVEDNGC